MFLPRSWAAFTLVTRFPSTAGYWPPAVTCKILFAVVPTSTYSEPLVVTGPPSRPGPAATLVTEPPAPQPAEIVLQLPPLRSQITSVRTVPTTSRLAPG